MRRIQKSITLLVIMTIALRVRIVLSMLLLRPQSGNRVKKRIMGVALVLLMGIVLTTVFNVEPVEVDLTTTSTTYTDVLLDNVDPNNHVYAMTDPSGSYRTYGQIEVPKSYIINGQLIIRVERHTDTTAGLPAPVCTEQPIDMSTTPPTVPTGVYENDDAHTVHLYVWCLDGSGGHIVTSEGGWGYVSVTSDTLLYEWTTSELSWSPGASTPGWGGWWFRHGTEWFQFAFTGIDTNLVDNYVTVGFHLGVTNRMDGEKGLDGLIDVVVNPLYDVTIEAYCMRESVYVNVSITMDGLPTGYNTPHTFTGLAFTHNFTVPNIDPHDHAFDQWSTGETSTTITVASDGLYTAYYWRPRIEKVRVLTVESMDAQLIAMRTNQVDFLPDLIRPKYIEILADEGMLVQSAPTASFHISHIGFNLRKPVLGDVNFRHALCHGYNQDEIIASIYRYTVTPIHSLVPPAYDVWMNPNVPEHPYNLGDPLASTEYPEDHSLCGILRYGGYTYHGDGYGDANAYWTDPEGDPLPEMVFWTPPWKNVPTEAEHGMRIVAEWHRCGLNNIIHQPADVDTYIHRVFDDHDFDIYMTRWDLDRFPTHLYDMTHSGQDVPGGYNAPGIHDPVLDDLVETVKYGLDHDAKIAAAREAQRRLYDPESSEWACAYMMLYYGFYFNAATHNLFGNVNSPGYGSDNFWTWMNWRWEPGHERIEDGKTLVIYCNGGEAVTRQQLASTTAYEWNVIGNVFDSLIKVNPYTHNDLAWQAESWTVEEPITTTITLDSDNDYLGLPAGSTFNIINGMRATFNLIDGLYWQDGNPVDASDAEFSLEFLRDNQIPRYISTWQDIVDVQVINSTAFTVYADVTSQFLLYNWADAALLLPPQVWSVWDGQPLQDILAYDPTEDFTDTGPWSYPDGPDGRPDRPFDPSPDDPDPTNNGPKTCLFGTGPFVYDWYDVVARYADLHNWDAQESNLGYFLSREEIHDLKVEMFHKIGDVDRNGRVYAEDQIRWARAFMSEPGDLNWDPDADLNDDGFVDGIDARIIGIHFGWWRSEGTPSPIEGSASSQSESIQEKSVGVEPSRFIKESESSSATEATIYIDPENTIDEGLQAGASFSINMSITDVSNLHIWRGKITWDPSILNFTNMIEGDLAKGSHIWHGKGYSHAFYPYHVEEQDWGSQDPPDFLSQWIKPSFTKTNDGTYASCTTPDAEQNFYSFGFNTSALTDVTKLEVVISAACFDEYYNVSHAEAEYLEVQVSNDGGATWGFNHKVPVYETEVPVCVDVTYDRSWTPSNLNNLWVRMRYKKIGVNATEISVDYLAAKVTDTLTVDIPSRTHDDDYSSPTTVPYNQTGSLAVTDFVRYNLPSGPLTQPWGETSEILQVDFHMKYEATASAAGDRYRIVFHQPLELFPTVHVLQGWTSSAAPLNNYTWTNIIEPDDGVWDWAEIDNLEFAVETDEGLADPDAIFRVYEAWITVTWQRSTDLSHVVDHEKGWCLFYGEAGIHAPGVSVSGSLATIEFEVLSYGASALNISNPRTELWKLCSPWWRGLDKIPHTTENGYFRNTIPGDIQGDTPGTPPDGDVDRYDFFAFLDHYGSSVGEPNYNILADLQGDTPGTPPDGDVDRYDFFAFLDNYGRP